MSSQHSAADNEEKSYTKELEDEVQYLRSLIGAYENLTIFNQQERLDDRELIGAYQQMAGLCQEELKSSKETAHAYEKMSELHRAEKREAEETIEALKNVSELTQEELKQLKEKYSDIRKINHPLQKEIVEILDEDAENEQHIIAKLNLLNMRTGKGRFYSHLFHVFLNLDFPEDKAKQYWEEIIALNSEVSAKLGRKVSIRVSMLDYFIDLNKHLQNPKIIEFKFFESTINEAIYDKLTGLLNRTHLMVAIKSSLRNAKREHLKVGVIMFDVDDFKKFNDFFGHVEGDKLLSSLGKIMGRVFSGLNTPFRYGGEEFLAIVECADEKEVYALADQVRKEFRSVWKKSVTPVSLSAGYAVFPDDSKKVEELISLADKALYDAKYSGKNIVLRSSERRRKNSRIFSTVPVMFKTSGEADDAFREALTVDISQGGLAIETDEQLNAGESIILNLKVGSEDEKMHIEGSICWTKKNEQNERKIYGVSFLDKDKSREIYMKYGKGLLCS